MIRKASIPIDFKKRDEERGRISRKQYLLFNLLDAKNLIIRGEAAECVIRGFFYPNDIKVIQQFIKDNPDVVIGNSHPKATGGNCTISIVKSNRWLSLNSKRLITAAFSAQFQASLRSEKKALQSRWIIQIDCRVVLVSFKFIKIWQYIRIKKFYK